MDNNIGTYGGGPAFPWQVTLTAGSVNPIRGGTVAMPTIEVMPGMSMRDYFAAKVIAALTANPQYDAADYDDAAREAYAQADAMLRARGA